MDKQRLGKTDIDVSQLVFGGGYVGGLLLHQDDETKRFINKDKIISDEKLVFLKAISNTIRSGMNIVGVSTPEQM